MVYTSMVRGGGGGSRPSLTATYNVTYVTGYSSKVGRDARDARIFFQSSRLISFKVVAAKLWL